MNRRCFHLLVILLISFAVSNSYAQSDTASKRNGILLSVGLRTTASMFSDDEATGMGTGGQFRLRFGNWVNTEWFADYITTDLKDLALRRDYHIGWSVLFYPLQMDHKLTPYFLTGHCFDYTKVLRYSDRFELYRWSSAVQGGLGTHYNLTKNFDLSLTAQYMIHLGNDIETYTYTDPGTKRTDYAIGTSKDLALEGHLLITFSMNIYIADLRRKK